MQYARLIPYYFRVIVDFWQVLAKDSALLDQIIVACLDMLRQNMPYEEKINLGDKKKIDQIATVIPLSVSHKSVSVELIGCFYSLH